MEGVERMNSPNELVKEFHDAFGLKPSKELCQDLIREEISEAQEAAAKFLKEMSDLLYVVEGAAFHHGFGALSDLDTDSINTLSLLGESLTTGFASEIIGESFIRVHKSNMSKLDDEGKPIFREDGKLLKGPNYREPELLDLVSA